MNDQQAQERRRFYRINEAVGLDFTVLTPDERLVRLTAEDATPRGTLLGHLYLERETQLPAMRELETTHPTVARYLRLLERQLDLLARAIGDPNDVLPDTPTHKVNLSAQGVRFTHNEAIEPNTALEVTLKLFPSRVRLVLLGEVVACSPAEGGAYFIAVDFGDIPPADQELLIKHIHSRQLGSLRGGAEEEA